MVTRKQLVSHWRKGLEQNEAEADRVSPQRSWIKRVYARVFRFLLAVYGGADWRADGTGCESAVADDDEIVDRGLGMEFVDLRTDGEGAPPKDVTRIRETLQTVHAVGPAARSGPYGGGLRADDWIVVASKRDGVAVGPYVTALRKSGIRCRRRWLGRDTVVQVRCEDREDALLLLGSLGETVRGSNTNRRLQFRGVGLGMSVGAMIGALLVLCTWLAADPDNVPAPGELLNNIAVGFALGSVFGGGVGYFCVTRRR